MIISANRQLLGGTPVDKSPGTQIETHPMIDVFTQLGIAFVDRHDVRRHALAIDQRCRL